MPIPDEINTDAYALISTIRRGIAINPTLATTRKSVDKDFHSYLELYFQGKHDGAVRAYCLSKKIDTRKSDGTQVSPGNPHNTAPWRYYTTHADAMVTEVIAQMQEKWRTNNYNNTVFVVGAKNMANIQKKRIGGYSYEMSYWYDVGDVYIAFHCYPN